MEPWIPTSKSIQQLKILLTERNSRIKMKRQSICQQHDYAKMKGFEITSILKKLNEKLINELDKQIAALEIQINEIIQHDQELTKQAELIKSIPGVGNVLSWYMITKTEGFTKITNPRKMACFSGVVPFEYQSGTSVYRKPRVSIFADKQLKSVLHLAAMSAVRHNHDLKVYYQRKVKDGKNKMSTLNAVRNKLIHRIFAVIKNDRPYQNNLVLS